MLQLGIRGLGIARFKFNPISWFLKGEPGAWYDPSDLTTLFQDSAGTTPMSAVGTVADQPVGLMLDKSKGLALGAELVTNGSFATDTGWTKGTGWTITGGQGVLTAGAGILQQAMGTVVVGTSYTVSINTNLAIQLRVGSANIGYFNPVNNTILCFITAIAGALIEIIPNGTQTGYVDNISVKQIAGNHAFQATAGNRPVLSARVNLLTKTEDFSDAVWTKEETTIGLTPIIAPDNTLTSYPLIETATTFTHRLYFNLGAPAFGTRSIYVKKREVRWVYLSIAGGTTWFDLENGVVGSSIGANPTTPTITPSTNGFYRISCTEISAPSVYIILGLASANGVSTYAGNTSNGAYIWGADLRPTNSGALLPPYQRVTTASDYDTVGFPLYLKANGTSSAMSTNSIDFTSTDKMTVVTGVRKLIDAAAGNVLEAGAMSLSQGCFGVYAPAGFGNLLNIGLGLSAGVNNVFKGSTGYVAPVSTTVTGLFDTKQPIDADKMLMRVNGVNKTFDLTSGSSAGTGNFGNLPLYLFARSGTQFFLNGQFYGAIIRGATSDTASVTQTENYMATKTGITF